MVESMLNLRGGVEVMTPTRTHIGPYAYAESETSSSVVLHIMSEEETYSGIISL